MTLQWRHNGRDSVSNHQPHDCLLNCLFRRRSKKTSKLRVTGLCAGNSPGTGEFPAQMASNAENVSIWWRHHELLQDFCFLSISGHVRIVSANIKQSSIIIFYINLIVYSPKLSYDITLSSLNQTLAYNCLSFSVYQPRVWLYLHFCSL